MLAVMGRAMTAKPSWTALKICPKSDAPQQPDKPDLGTLHYLEGGGGVLPTSRANMPPVTARA